jgi:hypothetical protein
MHGSVDFLSGKVTRKTEAGSGIGQTVISREASVEEAETVSRKCP